MKKIMILLVLMGFSCKSNKGAVNDLSQGDLLLYYSKGPCLGKCPVYELRVYRDGTVLYKGLDQVSRKGEFKAKLSPDELVELQATLEEKDFEVRSFKRIRGLPITRLTYGFKEYKFYVSQIDGPLKKTNSLIESLVDRITEP